MTLHALRLHWLKTEPSDSPAAMPYGAQHAVVQGVIWTESPRWAYQLLKWWQHCRRVSNGRLPHLHGPTLHTLASLWLIWRADATLALFESEGHALAALRTWLPPLRRKPLVIVACWLAQDLKTTTPARRDRLRRLYRQVTRVVVFSRNQRTILQEYLGLCDDQIAVVHFGIDTDKADQLLPNESDSGAWLSVGRDLGRDWHTLVDAMALTGLPCHVIARPGVLPQALPSNITPLPAMPESEYWQRLVSCRGLVLAVHELAYPSGQTVLLQAMALGKPCVITATPALADYLPSDAVMTTPPGDAKAMADAVRRLDADEALRQRLGRAARKFVRQQCDEKMMWAGIARAVRGVSR
ncbi:glycosyltransferase family 4 protein [Malikia sp.]|uniref:glycosyltransferase family 4 protein n=1 Tax=Malikia sp. TaxID=2070706 RepID=UPI00261301AF|nr:glycosyltransferase family 4 protein [Malikia sp.]MDD2728588.1 glycosyltransferase family 4 protein [Malikia sp.]